ncbi:MAG TPA: DUF447 domain-containing protein [Anaerolineae bacterium]
MIVETIVSTVDQAGRPNFAPMGVQWAEDELVIRPFCATHTYQNLVATGYGVVNITDDSGAFVESALGDFPLAFFPAVTVPGVVFAGACYWREVTLASAGGSEQRAELRCRIVSRGWQRDFLGYNRGRAAVIEAAILATRLHLLERVRVMAALDEFDTIVRKTGDAAERAALARVREYTRNWFDGGSS